VIKPPTAPAGSSPDVVAAYRDLAAWAQILSREPQPRKVYTLATLPAAADFAGATVPLSDGAGGLPTVTSINGSWTYPDGTTV